MNPYVLRNPQRPGATLQLVFTLNTEVWAAGLTSSAGAGPPHLPK